MTVFDDIKAKLDIVTLVSQYVQLKKAGRNFKGLCPFHNEATPSFMVSPEKQIAYCFGCHKGGDVFKFTQELENLDTHEVVELLADKAGIDVSKYNTKTSGAEYKVRKEQKEILQDVCEFSVKFYEEQLWNTPDGVKVLSYLRGRGILDETIKEFRLGLAPDSYDKTFNYLLSKSCNKDDIVLSGQASSKSTDASKVFDRFRLRLMFPINDKNGKTVGFGGRKLRKEDEPKYLNSPDTPVYNKSHLIYGWDKAKDAVKSEDKVIFVEGYFDVIAPHQAGFKNVVATSGTALTDEQLKFVKRYTENVLFVFDSDGAGMAATLRAVELAIKNGIKPSIVSLGEFKDPDEACKAGKFGEYLEAAKYFLDHYLDEFTSHILEGGKPLSAAAKLKICDQFFAILQHSLEEIEIRAYLEKLSFKLRIELQNLIDKFTRFQKDQQRHRYKGANQVELATQKVSGFAHTDYFFGFLLSFPETIPEVKDIISEEDFNIPTKDVYKALVSNYNGTALDIVAFFNAIDIGYSEALKVVSLFIETQYGGHFSEQQLVTEAVSIANRIKKLQERSLSKELKFQMKEARSKGEKGQEEQFFQKYSDLIQSR
ncbi:MAG: DNA primase [Candidatus Peregrinibacteria bacterium]|nr:DNA primase [Candidatus Peregrinibacteria bacterium]MDZ4244887.1 DNA primase [Candidatus Gracilibacteria bacterium]